jgi:hypothetical protein
VLVTDDIAEAAEHLDGFSATTSRLANAEAGPSSGVGSGA